VHIIKAVTVSVAAVFVLRPLLGDRGGITKQSSVCIPVPIGRLERKVLVDRSSLSSVGSLFHARGVVTEKALLPIRRRVCGMTRSLSAHLINE